MISIAWLYFIPLIIWGSTWIVILGQLGTVAPEVSVFYRFVIASSVAFLYAKLKKTPLQYNINTHKWFFFHGVCNFSLNYILTYHSERFVTTGLVAVIFSMLPYFNTIGMYVFFKEKIKPRSLLALICGGLGIFFIFKDKIDLSSTTMTDFTFGVIIAAIGTIFSSSGNLIAVRQYRKNIPVTATLSWAMFYGALFSLFTSLILQKDFSWDSKPAFIGSLFYLAIFGTFVAFLFYFKLIERVGASKAGYTSTMIPIIALLFSAVFENLNWSFSIITGLILAVIGQILILKKEQ